MTFGIEARDWLARSLHLPPNQLNLTQMKGSSSSSIYLVQSTDASRPERFVLRVLDHREWLADEPDLAEHEAAVLEKVQSCGLRGPRMVAYSSDEVGFGAPVVLMSFVEGQIELRPSSPTEWLKELARELAAIHRCPVNNFKWQFKSWVIPSMLVVPAWTTIPKTWERAIELFQKGRPEFRPVFLHRDYHPLNVLWNDGAISGVVDWINACQGPASVDLAHCRTNLTTMYGIEAADKFLEYYCDLTGGFEHNVYWDIDSLLNMCLPQPMFYPPWLDFGLEFMSQAAVNQRMDEYLGRVMLEGRL